MSGCGNSTLLKTFLFFTHFSGQIHGIMTAILPYLATVAAMRLLSLPGMMTGQILAGSSPAVAIQFQILIMVAIAVPSTASAYLGMVFSACITFDTFDRLREKIFC